MSLIDTFMEECCWLVKTKVKDGAGGYTVSWSEGEHFNSAIVRDTSMEARIAEKQDLKSVYTITTAKNVPIEYGDVLKRISDGKTFRVTSDPTDKKSPSSSSLDMKQATAERWELTS